MKKALTIAGSDSGGGAGIQADIKTFSAFGVFGMSVITSVTAQNTLVVCGVHEIPPEFVGKQMNAIFSDMGADGIKTGMLSNAGIVETVANKLMECKPYFVVVDPVMIAKGGGILLKKDAVQSLKNRLLPEATLVTPNIPEAEILSGLTITSVEEMKAAAKAIVKTGCSAVLIKGGHLEGEAIDLLYTGEEYHFFRSERIHTKNTHGTGCTYSAAILSNLILGHPLAEAVRISKAYITEAIRHSLDIGEGHGPLNHFVRIAR